jgi:hypothetical protein
MTTPEIRKPLNTKKMSTPMKPPAKWGRTAWSPMTISTATARNPSKAWFLFMVVWQKAATAQFAAR